MRLVIAVAVSACASSTALGVGPTIDSDGRLGVETYANGALGMPTITSRDRDGNPDAGSLWLFGFQATAGMTRAHPHVPVSFGAYVEYLQLGSPDAPWGFHVKLAFGAATWRGGTAAAMLTAGANRLTSESAHDTNDGELTYAYASGVDLSFRSGFTKAWQLALLYLWQRSTYASVQ